MVAVLSFLLSRWLGSVFSPEINSAILIAAGAVATLTNAASFQVLRKLDEPPTKDLPLERAERVIRLFDRRRKSFLAKWAMAVLMGKVVPAPESSAALRFLPGRRRSTALAQP